MKISFFILALIFYSCSSRESNEQKSETAMDTIINSEVTEHVIKAEKLKTGDGYSTAVISDAQKFILPVPAFKGGGEPLVYPDNDPSAGRPILDYEGKPIGKAGIVFFNYKDKSLQAAAGDGKGVIIINEVNEEKAKVIDAEIRKYQSDPDKLTLAELKNVLTYCHTKLDLSDMYNSSREYVKEKMTPVVPKNNSYSSEKPYGFKKRDDRDINQAIFIAGAFVFEGPAASPQRFENGGVIVEHGGKMRGVQPDIFIRTYKLANGKAIDPSLKEIRSQKP